MSNKAYLAEIYSENWAINEDVISSIHDLGEYSLEAARDDDAISAQLDVGGPVTGTQWSYYNDNGVATLSIRGPLASRSGLLSTLFGWPSTEGLMQEFRALEDDDSVKTIVLLFDTPGGAVTGISEFASMIAGCDKRTIAYVYGSAASAGYWLAAGCDKIVSADTGTVGSIGVVMSIRTAKEAGRIEITNSQSPYKRLDPATKEGRNQLESLLDQTADVFIETVARGRDKSATYVAEKFGRGALVGAYEALGRGMIDDVATLSETFSQLSAAEKIEMKLESDSKQFAVSTNPDKEKSTMPTLQELVAEHPAIQGEIEALTKAAREDGIAAERARATANHEGAVKVLSSDNYPKLLKEMASKVISGSLDLAALTGAVAAYDALKEVTAAEAAVADSEEVPPTPAADPGATELSTDGVLRSSADIDAELMELRRD